MIALIMLSITLIQENIKDHISIDFKNITINTISEDNKLAMELAQSSGTSFSELGSKILMLKTIMGKKLEKLILTFM
jgi:hypothetical protein